MNRACGSPPTEVPLASGRLCIVLAAVLWSSSGAFTKLLTQPTYLHLDVPTISPLAISFYRVLFAGLILLPTLRQRDVTFRRPMIPMAICFALMNAAYVSAQARGPAATAVLLQYTAPMWIYLAGVFWLGEQADRRGLVALGFGLAGVATIVAGGGGTQPDVVATALASGLAYAGVIVCLRMLRTESSRWLTILNHLFSAAMLAPLLVYRPTAVSALQVATLVAFGALQMAMPYWLVARGLRVVSAQEAGIITLLEPVLNPLWAYLISPGTETPPSSVWVGGSLIVGALIWKYWPLSRSHPS